MLEPNGVAFVFGGRIGERIRANETHWFKSVPSRVPRMVRVFAERKAGQPQATLPWTGEYVGKYLVSAIQTLRLTGDPGLRAVVAGVVRDLVATQGDDGYLGPFGPNDRMIQRQDKWDLWGHYHCMLGLLAWHQHQPDLGVLVACRRAADLFCTMFIGTGTRVAHAGSPAQNQVVAHVFVLLFRATGETKYLQMVREVEADWALPGNGNYVNGFQGGESFHLSRQPRWESLHAVQTLAELFFITNDERYRRALTQIWWSIVANDRHVTGGFSSQEEAVGNSFDPRPIETCATIGWMALTVDMLRLTEESRAADELELSTWNSILGSQSADGMWWTYDTPMGGITTTGMPHLLLPDPLNGPPLVVAERCPTLYDLRWQEASGVEHLSCCALHGPRGLALLSDWAVMRSADGVAVNYYGPVEIRAMTAAQRSVRLLQETDYPVGGTIKMTVTPDTPERFTLRLRIPGWSNTNHATLNGRPIGPVLPGSYLAIDHLWAPGDIVTLDLSVSPRITAGGQRPPASRTDGHAVGRIAIHHGPLLLTYDTRFDEYDPMGLPAIDTGGRPSRLQPKNGVWEPLVLLRFPTLNRRGVTLCDFASAGSPPWIPSRRWQFSRADGTVLASELTLLPDGTIQGSTHPNESRWAFDGTDLTFFHSSGTATTRFSVVAPENERIRLEGTFLLNPAITHVLHQVDGDVGDTIWEFSRPTGRSPLRLEPFGRIHGYRHPEFPNEVRWEQQGDALIFLDQQGRATTRFEPAARVGQGRTYVGSFIPNRQITHGLEEIDIGWVRGSRYVSWLPAAVPGSVTALSTRPGGTSLFVIAEDGQVWSRFFPDPDHPNQWSPWFALGPNEFPAGSRVTAVSTGPGGTSLYVLGFDGQVWTRFFPDPQHRDQWSPWLPLGPNVFPAESSVTALSTVPGGTSLYAIAFDEQVWTRFFPDAEHPGEWSAWLPLGPNKYCSSAFLSAVSTAEMNTGLYVVGFDRQVWTRFFPDPQRPREWSGWFPLGPNVFPAGSPVTALSTRPGGTSLFVIGFDGQVWSRFFPDPSHPNDWSSWFPLGPNVFPSGSRVDALSTGIGKTSLYVVGFDGRIWSRFFPGPRADTWSDWFHLDRPQPR